MRQLRLPGLSCVTPFVTLRRNTSGWFPFSLAMAGKPPPQRQGVVQPVPPSDSGVLSPRTPSVLPSSLRTLADLCRALGLRSVPRARSSAAIGCRPRKLLPRGHRTIVTFGALSQGLSHSCLRFVPPSRTTTQNSLPVADQPFRVGLFIPQSSFGEFHTFTRSPLPGLLLGAKQFTFWHCSSW